MPTISITFDGDAEIDGTLLAGKVEKIICPDCGYEIAELAGVYSVQCPNCGCHCVNCL